MTAAKTTVTIPSDEMNAADTHLAVYAIDAAAQAIAAGKPRVARELTFHLINDVLEDLDTESETETVAELVTLATEAGLVAQGLVDPRTTR